MQKMAPIEIAGIVSPILFRCNLYILMDILRVIVVLNTQKLLMVFMLMPLPCSSKYLMPKFGDT